MARVNEAALLGQLYNGDKYQGVTENRESGNYCFGNQHCASDGEKALRPLVHPSHMKAAYWCRYTHISQI